MQRKITPVGILSAVSAVILLGALVFGFIRLKSYLFPPPLSLPAGVEVKAQLLPEKSGPYHIGDLIPVSLEIEAVNGVDLRLLPISVADLGGLELVREEEPVTVRLRGGWRRSVRYFLSAWQTGTYTLPARKISYKSASGEERETVTEPLELVIVSLLPADKSPAELSVLELKGDKGPVDLPPNYGLLRPVLTGVAFIALLILLIRSLLRKRREKDPLRPEVLENYEPAHIIARRRLAALQQAGFLEEGKFKAYYSELSECLREYLEKRFHLPALEMTTREVLNSAGRAKILSQEQQLALAEVLNSSDLVKFAKYIPAPDEAHKAYDLVSHLIEETKEKKNESPEVVETEGEAESSLPSVPATKSE